MDKLQQCTARFERAVERRSRVTNDQEAAASTKELFLAFEACMAAYVEPENWPRSVATPIRPVPMLVAELMRQILAFVNAGTLPREIQELVGMRGQRRLGPREIQAIRWAYRYVRLARAGKIDDPSPVMTIVTWYGVRRQTVDGWMKRKFDDVPEDQFATFPDAALAEMTQRRAYEAGQIYREWGRGIAAAFHAEKARQRDPRA